jgi:hypothetical protein
MLKWASLTLRFRLDRIYPVRGLIPERVCRPLFPIDKAMILDGLNGVGAGWIAEHGDTWPL